jgi:hypothetical protein
MAVDIELRITLEGDAVPGLAEHRLSVQVFAEPLKRLLNAYRHIVEGLVRNASDREGDLRGRFIKDAEILDLELSALTHNSPLALELQCVPRLPKAETMPMFLEQIYERGAIELLDSIKSESAGIPRYRAVRRFLELMPANLERQRYEVWSGKKKIKEIEISDIDIEQPDLEAPRLERIIGDVIGVEFAPGPTKVFLRTSDRRDIECSATAEQVERALALRGTTVRVMYVTGQTSARLLWIRADATSSGEPTHTEKARFVFSRWDELLRRLAQ